MKHEVTLNIDRKRRFYLASCECGWKYETKTTELRDAVVDDHLQSGGNEEDSKRVEQEILRTRWASAEYREQMKHNMGTHRTVAEEYDEVNSDADVQDAHSQEAIESDVTHSSGSAMLEFEAGNIIQLSVTQPAYFAQLQAEVEADIRTAQAELQAIQIQRAESARDAASPLGRQALHSDSPLKDYARAGEALIQAAETLARAELAKHQASRDVLQAVQLGTFQLSLMAAQLAAEDARQVAEDAFRGAQGAALAARGPSLSYTMEKQAGNERRLCFGCVIVLLALFAVLLVVGVVWGLVFS